MNRVVIEWQASLHRAAWVIAKLDGIDAAEKALHYVTFVGEKEGYIARAMRNITPHPREEVVSSARPPRKPPMTR